MDSPGFVVTKAPGERLDYIFDWTTYMAKYNDTVVSVSSVVGENVVAEPFSWDGNMKVLVWASGGTRNTIALLTCNVVTAEGRTPSRSIRLLIRRR